VLSGTAAQGRRLPCDATLQRLVGTGALERATPCRPYPFVLRLLQVAELFDIDAPDEDDPFEIDSQAAHLFKHAPFGIDDVFEIWQSDPIFYPAVPPAHWLTVAQIGSEPLAPPDSGEVTQCRPIGCYLAAKHLADRYMEDR